MLKCCNQMTKQLRILDPKYCIYCRYLIDLLYIFFLNICMKSFQTVGCTLCMKERIHILKQLQKDPESVINSRHEVYGACRHRTKFHRFHLNSSLSSTDEGSQDPKRIGDGPSFYCQPVGTPIPFIGRNQQLDTVEI